jgi:hypothetical protein
VGFSVVRSLTARTATLGFLEYSSIDPAGKKKQNRLDTPAAWKTKKAGTKSGLRAVAGFLPAVNSLRELAF